MITEKLNNLIDEASAYSNYSSFWNPITTSAKDTYEKKYDSISTGDWINTYINTTTTSPDGITWTSPYTSTSSSSTSADIDALKSQINELNIKNKRLEDDIIMLKYDRDELRKQNCAFEERLRQLDAIVHTLLDSIEE